MSPKSGVSFKSILPHLAKDRFAVALDYPGYGQSDAPHAESPVRIEDYANAVWEVIDNLTLSKTHLVGHHTGSMGSVEATYQRPEQVASVVNIPAPLHTAEEQKALTELYSPMPI
jgi:pimeloyl-ACP methyl ester carboxylesterase